MGPGRHRAAAGRSGALPVSQGCAGGAAGAEIVLAWSAVWAMLRPLDGTVAVHAIAPLNSWIDLVARMVSWTGEFWGMAWLALVPLAVFGRARVTGRTLIGLAVVSAVVLVLKGTLERVRPVPTGDDSFPSGHATAAFVVACIWAHAWPRRRAWFYLGASFVAVSRVVIGRHFLSDVIFAALLGLSTGYLVEGAAGWRGPRGLGRRVVAALTGGLAALSGRHGPNAALQAVRLRRRGARGLCRLVLLVSIAGVALADGGGNGRFGRTFGPFIVLLTVWSWPELWRVFGGWLSETEKRPGETCWS